MSTYNLISFGLISFLFLASILSCSSLFLPINHVSYHENDQYYPLIENNNEENQRYLSSNDYNFQRYQRSSPYYPRANRNTWFRVSTYQHFKPTASEEIPNNDNLMRWG